MGNLNDLTGKKFGLLTVIKRVPNPNPKNRNSLWLCACSCEGKTGEGTGQTITTSQHLRSGHTTSCGCRRHEQYALKHGHSMKPDATYRAWLNMRSRCNNPVDTSYRNYGARGIKVCKRYDSYENFLADKGQKPPGYELDRIDLEGDYTPENTRWIPAHSGMKRNSIIVNLEGRPLKLTQAAKELGLDYFALYNLMHRRGLSFQKAVDKLRAKL
jgi:hypothetical protein